MNSGKLITVPLVAAKKKKLVTITDQTGMHFNIFDQGMAIFFF